MRASQKERAPVPNPVTVAPAVLPTLTARTRTQRLVQRLGLLAILVLLVFGLATVYVQAITNGDTARDTGRAVDRVVALLKANEAERRRLVVVIEAQTRQIEALRSALVRNGIAVPTDATEPLPGGFEVPGGTGATGPIGADGTPGEPGTSGSGGGGSGGSGGGTQPPSPRPSPSPSPTRTCRTVNPLTGQCVVASDSTGTSVGPIELPIGIPPLGTLLLTRSLR